MIPRKNAIAPTVGMRQKGDVVYSLSLRCTAGHYATGMRSPLIAARLFIDGGVSSGKVQGLDVATVLRVHCLCIWLAIFSAQKRLHESSNCYESIMRARTSNAPSSFHCQPQSQEGYVCV